MSTSTIKTLKTKLENGTEVNVYPRSVTNAIIEPKTNETLDVILDRLANNGGGDGSGSTVTVTQTVSEGTEIASIKVNDKETKIYSPNPKITGAGGTNVTTDVDGNITVDSSELKNLIENIEINGGSGVSSEELTEHKNDKNNPHNVTKEQVGLGNVDNTSDVNKPVSTAQQTAIDLAESNAKSYVDTKLANLVGTAPETLDTLGELAEAIQAIDGASDITSHVGDTTKHITAEERTNWNDANSKKHEHSNKTVLDNTTASYTTEDKEKLNNIETGANKYVHPTHTAKNSGLYKITVDDKGHVSGTAPVTKEDITNLGIPASNTTYNDATTSTSGLMSASDKEKLNKLDPDNLVDMEAITQEVSTNITENLNIECRDIIFDCNIVYEPYTIVKGQLLASTNEYTNDPSCMTEPCSYGPHLENGDFFDIRYPILIAPKDKEYAREYDIDNCLMQGKVDITISFPSFKTKEGNPVYIKGILNGTKFESQGITCDTSDENCHYYYLGMADPRYFNQVFLSANHPIFGVKDGKLYDINYTMVDQKLESTLDEIRNIKENRYPHAIKMCNLEKEISAGDLIMRVAQTADNEYIETYVNFLANNYEYFQNTPILIANETIQSYGTSSEVYLSGSANVGKLLYYPGRPVFVKGFAHASEVGTYFNIMSGTTLSSNVTQTPTEEGKAYLLLGYHLEDNYVYITSSHPIYKCLNGKLVLFTGDNSSGSSQTITNATTTTDGYMSAADKAKLDGIEAGAQVNQKAFGKVIVGKTTISSDLTSDDITFVAGSNITLTPDKTNRKITVAATGGSSYTHPSYTAQKSGLYNITVDNKGHVSAVTPVTKSDITALGIPDVTFSLSGSTLTITTK